MTQDERLLSLLTEISQRQLILTEQLSKIVELMAMPRESTLKILARQLHPIESQMSQVKSAVSSVVSNLEATKDKSPMNPVSES